MKSIFEVFWGPKVSIKVFKVLKNKVFQAVKKARDSDKVRLLGFYSLYRLVLNLSFEKVNKKWSLDF